MIEFTCLYYFTSAEIAVIEIQRLDRPEGAPLSDIYKWLVLYPKTEEVAEMTFKSMESNETEERREFFEGKLWFNQSAGSINVSGKDYTLIREKQDEVPSKFLDMIKRSL